MKEGRNQLRTMGIILDLLPKLLLKKFLQCRLQVSICIGEDRGKAHTEYNDICKLIYEMGYYIDWENRKYYIYKSAYSDPAV